MKKYNYKNMSAAEERRQRQRNAVKMLNVLAERGHFIGQNLGSFKTTVATPNGMSELHEILAPLVKEGFVWSIAALKGSEGKLCEICVVQNKNHD